MTFRKFLGATIIALPFIALFVFMVANSGWSVAFRIYGFVLLVVCIIALGVWLMASGEQPDESQQSPIGDEPVK